jgi:hypothetical protein
MKRNQEQRMADLFDRELDALIRDAREHDGDCLGPRWAEVADLLRNVRVIVREKMHPADRDQTGGIYG